MTTTNTALADQLEALAAKATPGPWHLHTGAIGINPWVSADNWTRPDGSYVRGGCILNMVAHDERDDDAALIAALRNNLSAILAALRATDQQALAERDAEIARLREEISILKNRRYTNAADELERARQALGGTDAG